MIAPTLFSRALAEFVGTFTLVAAGVGAVLAAGIPSENHSDALLVAALAHGLAIAVMVTAVGHISGGHFNPAVTFAMLVTRQIRALDAGVYWLSQLVAAAVGAAVINVAYPDALSAAGNGGVPALASGVSIGQGILLEGVMTFFLVWVIFGVAVDRDGAFAKLAGLPIGLTITVCILMGGNLTGGVMNPARAFGPALIFNHWSDWWVYWVGAPIGAAIAALAYVKGIRPRLEST